MSGPAITWPGSSQRQGPGSQGTASSVLTSSSGSRPDGELSPKLGGKPFTPEAEEQRPCRCPLPEPSCPWPGGSCPPWWPWSPGAGSAYTALAPSKVLRHSCFSLTQAVSPVS